MKLKKVIVPLIMAGAALSGFATADAATGIVNLNQILAKDAAFQSASKTYAAEQAKLEKDFAAKSKNMTDAQKQKLAQDYQKQLIQKDNELIAPIQKKINDAVAKVAKEKNVDTVVVPGGYIYGTISVDLTQDVEKALK